MHGIVFSQLRKYVETKHGRHAWNTLLKHATIENRAYLSVSEYPDTEMEALVSAAAMMSRQRATVVLGAFGVFIALPLMNMYGHLIPEEWKTLDVIRKDRGNHPQRGPSANPRRKTSCTAQHSPERR